MHEHQPDPYAVRKEWFESSRIVPDLSSNKQRNKYIDWFYIAIQGSYIVILY